MTREQKLSYINSFCNEHNCDETCPCFKFDCIDTDKEIDSMYKAIINYQKGGQPEIDESENDNVEHPRHYSSTSIECIDAMEETQGKDAVINFCVCNAFKYLWRHNLKNGTEDIKKANWYLNKAVELMEKE